MTKMIAVAALSAYLGAGLFAGLSLQRAIPALNPVGVAWVTATWPNVIRCARVSSGCSPVGPTGLQPFMFSFGGGK